MAFIFGGIVFIATLAICFIIILANEMQPAPRPDNQTSPWPMFIIGGSIAAAIVASHWFKLSW
jgi:uncharacterized membrane protein